MLTRRSPWGSLLIAFVLLAAPAAHGADRFYEELVEDGLLAADRGDHARAAKVLRLACFGPLEEPPMLARCLTHLALAQAQLDDREAFRTTVDRLVRIEKRFRAYDQAEIADADRRMLARRAEELLPEEDSEQTAMFRMPDAVPPPEAAPEPATPEPAAPEPATPRTASLEHSPTEITAPGPETSAPELPTNGDAPTKTEILVENPPEIVAEDLPPLVVAPQSAASEPGAPEPADLADVLARAQEVKLTADRERILEELERLRPLAADYPQHRELQYLAAELAYRLSLWQESRDYFERGGVDSDRPDLAFLFAVTLYETGETERAADVLESCLAQLDLNPFVDGYVEKILGSRE